MPVTFQWHGMAEMLAALRSLPDDLKAEAVHLVEGRANRAVLAIKTGYPVRSGDLRDSVEWEVVDEGRFGVRARIRNTAPHAWIFDEGTQVRHTDIGANRGAMPAAHVFVPPIIRERRALFMEDFAALLTRYGMVPHARS